MNGTGFISARHLTVSVPTLAPRPADHYDVVCRTFYRTMRGAPQRHAECEDVIRSMAEAAGVHDVTAAIDDAYTHGRTMDACMHAS